MPAFAERGNGEVLPFCLPDVWEYQHSFQWREDKDSAWEDAMKVHAVNLLHPTEFLDGCSKAEMAKLVEARLTPFPTTYDEL